MNWLRQMLHIKYFSYEGEMGNYAPFSLSRNLIFQYSSSYITIICYIIINKSAFLYINTSKRGQPQLRLSQIYTPVSKANQAREWSNCLAISIQIPYDQYS